MREHFEVAFLDSRHRLIAVERMFSGSVDGAQVYPRVVVQRALALNAAAVMVAHNHPSGQVQPSAAEAMDAFSARRIIETGILQEAGKPLQRVITRLRRHIAQEQKAIAGADSATRAFLLADFHVCLAEQMGHRLLADTLRDLTARTTLAATLYQSTHSASQSCAEHERIVAALERGDTEGAKALLLEHIGMVERSLEIRATETEEPGDRLRATLAPVLKQRL